jgi:hypothetical protein
VEGDFAGLVPCMLSMLFKLISSRIVARRNFCLGPTCSDDYGESLRSLAMHFTFVNWPGYHLRVPRYTRRGKCLARALLRMT